MADEKSKVQLEETMEGSNQQNLNSSPRAISWKDEERIDSDGKTSHPIFPSLNSVPAPTSVEAWCPTTPPQAWESGHEGTFSSSPFAVDRPLDDSPAGVDRWQDASSTPPDKTSEFGEDGEDEEAEDDSDSQLSEHWDDWQQDGYISPRASSGNALVRRDSSDPWVANDDISTELAADDSRSNVSTNSATAAFQVVQARGSDNSTTFPHHGLYFIDSLSDELATLKVCAKRALELGKRAQRCAAAEVSQLRGEKMHAQAVARRYVELNHELRQQVLALRDENQKLRTEKHLEVLAIYHEREEVARERDNLQRNVQDEKKKYEKLLHEKNSILSTLLEERMKSTALQEASELALQEEAAKLAAMASERDAAVTALQEETQKLDEEREGMLDALRDMTSKFDTERDTNQKSLRRSSIPVDAFKNKAGSPRGSPGRKISKWNSIQTSIH